DALSFAPWGFKRLQINQDALDTGAFALTDAAGILPDGLIFDIPDSDPPPSPKNLIDSFEPDQKTLDVFLAIPHYRDRGLNVSISRRLVEMLAAKSTTLSGNRRQKNLSLAEFGTSDIANFWLLYTINSHFPLLQHIFETRRGHPENLFATMLSLGGCLTTFSK